MKEGTRTTPAPPIRDLHPARLLETCATKRLGRPVVIFDRAGSTNEIAMEAAADGVPEGLIVIAEEQTAGRGRKGRSWFSTKGKSLTFSIVLRPPTERAGLTALFGLAAARALDCFAEDIALKWPNDIFCRGKKLAGILAGSQEGVVVMGMGINVNEEPGDFPKEIARAATSLRIISGSECDRSRVLGLVLEMFDDLYDEWLSEGFDLLYTEVESRLLYIGKRVTIDTGDERANGIMLGITGEGYVRIDVGGRKRIFSSGDLSVRRT